MCSVELMCAYFGNYYRDSFIEHVAEMKSKGFTSLVLCMPEEAIRFNLGNLGNMVKCAQDSGLKVYADPWGYIGAFDGEALTTYNNLPCLVSTEFKNKTSYWLDIVNNRVKPDGIFWDNPKLKCNCCKQIDFITYLVNGTLGRAFVCISAIDNMNNPSIFSEVAQIHGLYSVGTDPYLLAQYKLKNFISYFSQWCHVLTGVKNSHVWIQMFGLPQDCENLPIQLFRIAINKGIKNIGVWGFRACEAVSSVRAANFKAIWENFNALHYTG